MIDPKEVTLASNEGVRFTSDATQWTLKPEKGNFDPNTRIYTAPRLLFNSCSVFLTARDPDNPARGGTAEIHLTSSLFWMGALAMYWPVLFVLVMLWGWLSWPGIPPDPVLMVNPPAVTIGNGQTQQFAASLNDIPEADITWSATSGLITPTGFYSPPKLAADAPEQTVTVTATRNSDRTKAASAIVIVSPGTGLFLYPSLSHAHKGEKITLIADGGDTNIDWPTIAPKGIYTAPNAIPQRRTVNISVTSNGTHVASARIILVPDGGASAANSLPDDTTLISFALAAGALGAWLASVKSFVSFIGTRSFVPSWGLFYLFRPAFGAGLALVAHMAHRSGNIGSASTASNPAVIVFYSALIGLFSDEFLQKLHDIFCTVFGVQDKRTDKMSDKTTPGQAPVITVATATSSTADLIIDGGNFVSVPTVLINNIAKPVTFISDKKLQVKLDSAPTVGTILRIKVRNPDGKESAVLELTVRS